MDKLISISIDVTKIPREAIKPHDNGSKYLSLDIWVKEEPDKYGKDASVNISQNKEQRDAKEKKIYIGNGKKVFGWDRIDQAKVEQPSANQTTETEEQDEIPF